MCPGLFLTYSVALMIGLGIWPQLKETMDILNIWTKILSCFKEILTVCVVVPSLFDDSSTSLKVIAVLLVTHSHGSGSTYLDFQHFSHLPFSHGGKAWFHPFSERTASPGMPNHLFSVGIRGAHSSHVLRTLFWVHSTGVHGGAENIPRNASVSCEKFYFLM